MLPSKYNLLSLSVWFTVFQQEHLSFHFITRSINNPIKNYLPITTWRVCVVVLVPNQIYFNVLKMGFLLCE